MVRLLDRVLDVLGLVRKAEYINLQDTIIAMLCEALGRRPFTVAKCSDLDIDSLESACRETGGKKPSEVVKILMNRAKKEADHG